MSSIVEDLKQNVDEPPKTVVATTLNDTMAVGPGFALQTVGITRPLAPQDADATPLRAAKAVSAEA